MTPLLFRRSARAPLTLALAGAIVLGAVVLWLVLDAAWWIVLPMALIALPALIEAARGRIARLDLDETRLTWASGARRGDVALNRIAQARFRTTFDLSQRLILRLDDGRRQNVPPECLPPGRRLEQALAARGVPTHRTILRD
ncbi:hypothetical protein [Oceaniglobus trochenteri]|uniref:hypothetical protein n=1 Tax=Oceaniglobus trochenteri TaxID=2763260 RepID=UPI001D001324|nr:hypothetical protein [Oceaniglobus trochenteri]